jgi:hypothetical protein
MTRFKEYSAGYDPETSSGEPYGPAAFEQVDTEGMIPARVC